MYEMLKQTIDRIISIDKDEWQALKNSFEVVEVPAKHLLTQIDDVENRLYFVVKGVLRLFCISAKGDEATIFLFKEYNFASCYQSFLTGQNSEQALEAIEDCTLLAINKQNFDRLHQTVPKINLLTRIIADQRFINSQRIFMGFITRSPEERYLDFEKQHGDLLLRVPLNIISSFLGITPVSLSRIRKRVSRK